MYRINLAKFLQHADLQKDSFVASVGLRPEGTLSVSTLTIFSRGPGGGFSKLWSLFGSLL